VAPTETVVESADEPLGPSLPEGQEWPTETVQWWDTWRRSAQAQTFTLTDWSFLLDTAVLHRAFWLGKHDVAAELRLRVAKFGATPEDRMRLRLAVEKPAAKTNAPVPAAAEPANAADRRARLSAALSVAS
jgi:hypothetical protein